MKKFLQLMLAFAAAFLGLTAVHAQSTAQQSPATDKSKSMPVTPSAVASLEHPAQASPVVFTSDLQMKLGDGQTGALVFYKSESFKDNTALIAYINNDLKIHCRMATDKEIELIGKKFGKDEIYGAAQKMKLGEGDPATSFHLSRSVAEIVIQKGMMVPKTASNDSPAGKEGNPVASSGTHE